MCDSNGRLWLRVVADYCSSPAVPRVSAKLGPGRGRGGEGMADVGLGAVCGLPHPWESWEMSLSAPPI